MLTVYCIADGTLSPLTGFVTEDVYIQVFDAWTIDANGKKLARSIPLSLPVIGDLAEKLNAGDEVALTSPAGDVVATIKVESVFEWDKIRYIKQVYLTDRPCRPPRRRHGLHPPRLQEQAPPDRWRDRSIKLPEHSEFGDHIKSPAKIRELLSNGGWDVAVTFQTRNPLHRAQEYALQYGLEVLLREGKTPWPCSSRCWVKPRVMTCRLRFAWKRTRS